MSRDGTPVEGALRATSERVDCFSIGSNPGSNIELNAIVATLSCGPFGISDKAGATNITIVARACRSDGLIMQPDRPATYIDAMFDEGTVLGANVVFSQRTGQQPANGHVWSTFAAVPLKNTTTTLPGRPDLAAMVRTHYVLSINLSTAWKLAENDLYPPIAASTG